MSKKSSWFSLLVGLVVAVFVLSACGPAATPTPAASN